MPEIAVVVGTRPEIIKMAPIIKELEKRGQDYLFVYSGQHHDYEMSKVFIEELELSEPDTSFVLESSNPAAQIGEMMIKLEKTLEKTGRSKLMLIQGDTNTMLAAGLTALKLKINLGHIEAGLRSYDWRMPEEHNRRMIDHVSNYLFAPTELAKRNLLEEHAWGEIYVTGNTVIDSLNMYFWRIDEKEEDILQKIGFDEYALTTFHRAENVDNPETLRNFVAVLKKAPIPMVFPIHPRTRKRLVEFALWDKIAELKKVLILPPQSYFSFLALLKNSKVVLTDSGGIQEEATHPKIKKPVLVLRTSTERPEAVIHGFARIVGVNPVVILAELERILNEKIVLPDKSPFGDGNASKRILRIVASKIYGD